MYSKNLYGTIKYSSDDVLNDININNEKDLLQMLPSFYHNSDFVREFMKSNSIEASLLNYYVKDLVNNLYVKTATWGLDYFEEELGLVTDRSISYEERRERVLAKKRANGTTTKKMIKNIAEAFSGGEVEIIENFSDYSFIVKFIGIKGIPKNLQLFKNMLEEIKPAHLSYELAFTYTVWDFVMQNKPIWSNLNSETWDSLKLYEERMI